MSDKRKRKPLEPDEDRVDATGVPTTRNEHRVLYLKPCPTKLRPIEWKSACRRP